MGRTSLKSSLIKDYLGQISCGDLSFKECVDEVKVNQQKIVSELEHSSSYAVKM